MLDIKFSRNKDYSKFTKKLAFQIVLIGILSIITTLIANSIMSGKFGKFVVNILTDVFHMSRNDAYYFYSDVFRYNKIFFLSFFGIVMLYIMAKILIRFMTSYFNEISNGLDLLIAESDEKIKLSEEMHFLESRMNQCKDILLQRKIDLIEEENKKIDLLMYLAHDIRTPLTSISGYLDLLDNEDLSDEEYNKYFKIVLDKTEHLEILVEQFFEITRLQSQEISLNKVDIDINLLLNQLKEEMYPIAMKKNQNIIINSDDEIFANLDPEKIVRVLNNIIKNAINYGYGNSDIVIIAKAQKNNILIKIENSGDTINKKDIELLFNKFYRADKSRSTTTGGTGLGLAISLNIVKAHNGILTINSENNKTTFNILLPIN